jgi:hypothetical protein
VTTAGGTGALWAIAVADSRVSPANSATDADANALCERCVCSLRALVIFCTSVLFCRKQ